MVDISSLFRPFHIGSMSIENRIVMAPMTREKSPGGVPSSDVADYYARRAKAQVGLILTEGTTIGRLGGSSSASIPNFFKDDALRGWSNVADLVHENGGKIGPQLWHEGMMRKEGTGPHPEHPSDSPSGVTHKGKPVYEAPSEQEVEDMIQAYVDGVVKAKELGFDCAEFHGAHGYLIDQFFWSRMNLRQDRFGGNLVQRAQFAAEIIRMSRQAVGNDFPLILRFSQWKQQDFGEKLAQTPQELEKFLTVLVDAGISMLHCSTRRFWEPEFDHSDLTLAGWAKKLTNLPTIAVGSVGLKKDFIGSLQSGQDAQKDNLDIVIDKMERDEFDLIAVGRALLQDHEWAQKVHQGRFEDLKDYDPACRDILY